MSRKGSTPQRAVLPDPKHGSETIARFINMVMQSGKKSIAEKIVYGAMDVIGERNPDALQLVEKALGNVSPSVEVTSRRRRHLPGAGRSACVPPHGAGHALVDRIGAQARRELDAAQACRRTDR